ncbi:MAG: hypothetical protein IKD44_10130 [Lentisphaeria bacterium]|nr:hypothetical protein [Lentisphaeria bacterium]
MFDVDIPQILWGRIAFCSGILLFLFSSFLTFAAIPERIGKFEAFARNRWIGLLFGWVALALCVPHAVVVSPQFLLPFLWPIAVIVPILGFFFVDYPAARALGGVLILLGYSLVHYTFEFRTPGFPLLAFIGWFTGIAGIWISGKPCAMRDYFRMAGSKKWFRLLCCGLWGAAALSALWALVMTREGGAL